MCSCSSTAGRLSLPGAAMRSGTQQAAQIQPSVPPPAITRHAPAVAHQLFDPLLDDQAANVLVVRFHLSSSRGRRRDAESAREACVVLDPTTGSPFVGSSGRGPTMRYAVGAGVSAGSRGTVVAVRLSARDLRQQAERATPRRRGHEWTNMSVFILSASFRRHSGATCAEAERRVCVSRACLSTVLNV
jgi:hypothetical protein